MLSVDHCQKDESRAEDRSDERPRAETEVGEAPRERSEAGGEDENAQPVGRQERRERRASDGGWLGGRLLLREFRCDH